MANDTTTTLNPGVGGDLIDETLVTQTTSGVSAKRTRVAVGGDDGSLQNFESDSVRTAGIVKDYKSYDLLTQLLIEAKTHTMLLKMIVSVLDGDFDDDDIDDFDE